MSAADGAPPTRNHYLAISTRTYGSDWHDLDGIEEEVAAVHAWLCSPDLGDRGFVQEYVALAADPTDAQLRDGIEDFARGLRHRHAGVVFLTGHGHLHDGGHHLVVHAAPHGDGSSRWRNVRTSELFSLLRDKADTDHLLVVVDTCHAAAVRTDLAAFTPELRSGWLVVASAGRDVRARTGELTTALTRFLASLDPDGAGRRFRDYPHLQVGDFLDGLEDHMPRGQQLVPVAASRYGSMHRCLPNPAYEPPGPPFPLEEARRDLAPARENVEDHWSPRARGATDRQDRGWWFVGRENVMRTLVAQSSLPGLTVVTGAAGTGKSALLARLVMLSDPNFRAEHSGLVEALPVDQTPAPGAVTAAVLATGKLDTQLLVSLLRFVGAEPPTDPAAAGDATALVECWRRWAEKRGSDPRVTIVLDGLDEASAPERVVSGLIGPLLAQRHPPTLVVGLRSMSVPDAEVSGTGPDPTLLDRLVEVGPEGDTRVLRVDRPADELVDDIAASVHALLVNSDGSPYASRQEHAARVAAHVAAHTGGSFLVAGQQGRSLASRTAVVDPDDPEWNEELSQDLLGIFLGDLGRAFLGSADRARSLELLRALAFGRGRGIPWNEVWPTVADSLSRDGTRFGHSDIATLLGGPMGGYVLMDREDDVTVYRLLHDRLRETLRTLESREPPGGEPVAPQAPS